MQRNLNAVDPNAAVPNVEGQTTATFCPPASAQQQQQQHGRPTGLRAHSATTRPAGPHSHTAAAVAQPLQHVNSFGIAAAECEAPSTGLPMRVGSAGASRATSMRSAAVALSSSHTARKEVSQSFATPQRPMTLEEFQRTLAQTVPQSMLTRQTLSRIMAHLTPRAYEVVFPLFTASPTLAHFLQEVAQAREQGWAFRGFEMSLHQFQSMVLDDIAKIGEGRDVDAVSDDVVRLIAKLGPESRALVAPLFEHRTSLQSFAHELKDVTRTVSSTLAFTDNSNLHAVFDHLMQVDSSAAHRPVISADRPDVTHRMRGILIDWMVEVSVRFSFRKETLFLAVSLLDRYLMRHVVQRHDLQLVGTASLVLASKYEEIYPPTIAEFVRVAANVYQHTDILRMERSIFTSLEYRVTFPTTLSLSACFLAAQDPTPTDMQRHLVSFILFTMLIKFPLDQHLGGAIAATAVYISRRWCDVPTASPPDEVRRLIVSMIEAMHAINTGNALLAIRNMFAHEKFCRVSSFPIPSVELFADVVGPSFWGNDSSTTPSSCSS